MALTQVGIGFDTAFVFTEVIIVTTTITTIFVIITKTAEIIMIVIMNIAIVLIISTKVNADVVVYVKDSASTWGFRKQVKFLILYLFCMSMLCMCMYSERNLMSMMKLFAKQQTKYLTYFSLTGWIGTQHTLENCW